MTMLSKPSAEKTRALRAAVASYMDHIGLPDRAEFMRAQPDDFTQWSDYAHQLVTVMDKKTFQKDLPPNIEGMMDFSKSRVAARTEKNRALGLLAEGIGKGKKGLRQSENVIDRQDKGRLPVEPSLLAQALAEAQDIGERGQRGFGKIIAALMGESEQAAPSQPRSKEDAARAIRSAYGAEAWGAPSPMTIDKHAWDAAGNPSFGGPWVKDLEQKMANAWAEANKKDQSTVGGDTYGFDPAHFPGGLPPSMNDRDLDGDGIEDFAGQFAAGGRNSRMLNKKGLWGKETKQLGVPTTPGAAVTAPVGGKVVYADEFQSYGYTVIVRGEDGTHYDINGMQAGLVKPGDQVTAGQPIGVAGEQTNIGMKGANGKWGDPTSLADGLQSAGTAPVAGYDGGDDSYGVGSTGMDAGTSTGLMGGPTAAGYADAGVRGAPMMPGVAPSTKAAEIAKALAAPSMDAALMGGTPAQSPNTVPDNDLRFSLPDLETPLGEDDVSMVDLVDAPAAPTQSPYGMDEAAKDIYGGLQSLLGPAAPDQPAFERGMPEADPLSGFDKAYDAANKGLTDAFGGLFGGAPADEGTPAFERGFNGLPSTTAPSSTPDPAMGRHALDRLDRTRNTIEASIAARPSNISMTAIKGVEGLLGAPASTSVNSAASKALAAALASQPANAQTLVGPTSDWASPALNAFGVFGSETNYGTPSTALADVDPTTAFTRDISAPPAAPSLAPSQMTTAYNGFGQFGDEAKYGMSDIDAAIDTDPMTSFTRSMDVAPSMVAGDPMGDMMGAYGSFGGIGSPTADQAEAQRGMPSISMAGMSGTPSIGIPSQKADAFAPGLRGFNNAFSASVKSVGPKYSKAIAEALSTPSIANQVAAVEASKAYTSMNGLRNNPEVLGLRSQQIGDFAMANPALGNALGLSMGQQGQQGLGGGIGSDPFGGGRGPMGGPGFGAGLGGGGPGQPSGPSFGGPSGPSAGPSGVTGRGPSSNPGSGGGLSGGPGAGPGYGGGNPAGSPSPGGVTTGRGPSSNPGQGGGLSAAAASAIGAALSHEAAAAAASDAARGFGGYGMGPSFSGGFF